MPSTVILFWCIFCTVKENQLLIWQSVCPFLCLLIGGATTPFVFGWQFDDYNRTPDTRIRCDAMRWTVDATYRSPPAMTYRAMRCGVLPSSTNPPAMWPTANCDDYGWCPICRARGRLQWRMTTKATSFTVQGTSCKTDVREYHIIAITLSSFLNG